MHELNIFWQWLTQCFRHCLGTPVSHKTATNLGFNLFFEGIDSAFVFIFFEAFLKSRQITTSFLFAGLHEFLQHVVQIKISQSAVQVIRASDRTTWLHPSKALHGLFSQGTHHGLVAIHQGFHQHLRYFLGRQAVHPAGRPFAFALLHLLLHLAPHLLEFVL